MDILELEGFTVLLWLHTSIDPPHDEWDASMARVEDYLRVHVVALHRVRGLVVSDGGAPNAKQRASLRAPMAKGKSSIVTTVLTNPVKRGVATALMWILPSFGFFEPGDTDAALRHIDLGGQLETIWKHLGLLQQKLPPNATLDLIAKAYRLSPLSC